MPFYKKLMFRGHAQDSSGKTYLGVKTERFLSSNALQMLFQDLPTTRGPWENALSDALSILEEATSDSANCHEGTLVGPSTLEQLWSMTSLLLKGLYRIQEGESLKELGIEPSMYGILSAILGLKPCRKFVLGRLIVSRLIKAYPGCVNDTMPDGRLPLHLAVSQRATTSRQLSLVALVIQAKPANSHVRDPSTGVFPINMAAMNQFPQSILIDLYRAAPYAAETILQAQLSRVVFPSSTSQTFVSVPTSSMIS